MNWRFMTHAPNSHTVETFSKNSTNFSIKKQLDSMVTWQRSFRSLSRSPAVWSGAACSAWTHTIICKLERKFERVHRQKPCKHIHPQPTGESRPGAQYIKLCAEYTALTSVNTVHTHNVLQDAYLPPTILPLYITMHFTSTVFRCLSTSAMTIKLNLMWSDVWSM